MEPTTDNPGPAAALYAALAKAQGAFQPIVKNREVSIDIKDKQTGQKKGTYTFRYADLEEILTKTRPALSANGLALIQTIEHGGNGPLLVCRLVHAAGGMMASEVLMPGVRDMADPKAFGAAITYLRRYMVTAMLGVAADDDLDEDGQELTATTTGQATAGKPPVQQPQRRERPAGDTAAPPPAAAPATAGSDEPATAGEIAYITKKIQAKGLTSSPERASFGTLVLTGKKLVTSRP